MRDEQTAVRPPKMKWVLALLAGGALLVLAFALVLRWSWRSVFVLDGTKYQVETTAPAAFRYSASPRMENGAYILEGWACLQGERILTIDSWAVLYDVENGKYYRLPTAAQLDEAATETINDGGQYARAGFSVIAPLAQLEKPPEAYELCFAYRSNENNLLVHTGCTAAEGGAA